MVTEIESRKTQWIARVVMLVFVPLATMLVLPTQLKFGFGQTISILFIVIYVAMFTWFILKIALEFICMPKGVVLDTDDNTIEVRYFFLRSKLIHLDEIESVSSNFIVQQNKQQRYEGILVNLKSGQKVLFSECYLAGYVEIYDYLISAGIPETGVPKYSILLYAWQNYQLRHKII